MAYFWLAMFVVGVPRLGVGMWISEVNDPMLTAKCPPPMAEALISIRCFLRV